MWEAGIRIVTRLDGSPELQAFTRGRSGFYVLGRTVGRGRSVRPDEIDDLVGIIHSAFLSHVVTALGVQVTLSI